MDINKRGVKLYKKDMDRFLKALSKFGEIYAPVKDDVVKFSKVTKAKEICFSEHAWFPAKQFIFPEGHTVFSFNKGKVKTDYSEIRPTVLFGLRRCDLGAFAINDKLFASQKYKDPQYIKRRENLFLIGLYCYDEIDKYCFCESMEVPDHYDIMLHERGEGENGYYHVKAGSEKGKNFLKGLKWLSKEEVFLPPPTKCNTELASKDIKDIFDDSIWEKGAKQCISCGHCTNLCPTCLCFNLTDEVELDGSGVRKANLASCMFKDFTSVAGGHVFREKRVDRFKHRIYHKLDYFKDAFGMYMCTGCGRCIRGCPEKIDWISLINEKKGKR